MAIRREKVVPVDIEDEMRTSYLDYAMSVIVGRALPRVRDGLKPVHRRILFAMRELGLASNRPYKKSAAVVGDVLAKYHPHGDGAVYDAIVRMVQDFSLRYPLIDGQGNFGSVDGDAAAAYRYTEVRLTPIAEAILADIDKETVDFISNYDASREEPTVLPCGIPNLLVSGSSGIAVGMATNIPPHNLGEIVDALIALIKNPEINTSKLMKHVHGPDFPTGGIVIGAKGIRDAYESGKGRLVVRARVSAETRKGGRERLVISEIPYQVNKSVLIERIARLVRDRRIDGITDLRDESDRDGMRIVLELKRDAQREVILNQLYRHTQMQDTFGVIMLALVDGQPRVLNLKQMLEFFLEHRHEVVVRRTKFELDKAEKRAHILEGLKIALDHIDAIVTLIKKSRTPETARQGLVKEFKLSELQAQAILDMRLARLTGLERKKVDEEYLEIIKLIAKLKSILASRAAVMEVVRAELLQVKKRFADDRRTEIVSEEEEELTVEDLIAEEDMVVTVSHRGYYKRMAVNAYRRQGRGGKGMIGVLTREDDFAESLIVASTHHYILFFTDRGRCYWLKVHEIVEGGRLAKGRAITNMLALGQGEAITAYVPVRDFMGGGYLVMATKNGLVKRIALSEFSHPRRTGIHAVTIREGDSLIEVKATDGSQDVMLITHLGKAIRFHESEVRPMGRSAAGIKGVSLRKGDEVVGMVAVKRQASLLIVTERGYGKRTAIADYRVQSRSGLGLITLKVSEKNGPIVAALEVVESDGVIIMSSQGQVIRIAVSDIREMGRSTQGVRLIDIERGDRVCDVARIVSEEGPESSSDSS